MEIMFTDIINSGTYSTGMSKIFLSVEYAIDSPKEITFTIISDDVIKKDDDGTLWKLND
jgi:hypothetical protein